MQQAETGCGRSSRSSWAARRLGLVRLNDRLNIRDRDRDNRRDVSRGDFDPSAVGLTSDDSTAPSFFGERGRCRGERSPDPPDFNRSVQCRRRVRSGLSRLLGRERASAMASALVTASRPSTAEHCPLGGGGGGVGGDSAASAGDGSTGDEGAASGSASGRSASGGSATGTGVSCGSESAGCCGGS